MRTEGASERTARLGLHRLGLEECTAGVGNIFNHLNVRSKSGEEQGVCRCFVPRLGGWKVVVHQWDSLQQSKYVIVEVFLLSALPIHHLRIMELRS